MNIIPNNTGNIPGGFIADRISAEAQDDIFRLCRLSDSAEGIKLSCHGLPDFFDAISLWRYPDGSGMVVLDKTVGYTIIPLSPMRMRICVDRAERACCIALSRNPFAATIAELRGRFHPQAQFVANFHQWKNTWSNQSAQEHVNAKPDMTSDECQIQNRLTRII